MRLTALPFLAALCLAGGLFTTQPAIAIVTIPVYPGANDVIRRFYPRDHFPADWVKLNADSATVLVYSLSPTTDPEAVADFYSRTMEKANWNKDHVRLLDTERYLIFNRERQQLVIHIKEAPRRLSVDALGLDFAVGISNPTGGAKDLTNFSDQVLSQNAACPAAGGIVHVVCPAGVVRVSTHTGLDVNFRMIIHAAVDYPGLAVGSLKNVQIVAQSEANGLSLGVNTGSAGKDPSVRLAYEYAVVVPEGVNVMVEVQRAIDPLFSVQDGKVEVDGAVADVNILTSGPVEVSGASGNVSVTTVDDPVFLRNLSGNITVHTTNMWIKAVGIKLNGDVDLETSGDQVEAHLASVQDGSFRCKTSNSAIRLWLPADTSGDFDVRGADPIAPFELPAVTDVHGGKHYHGPINGGKIRFGLETSGGGQVYIQNK